MLNDKFLYKWVPLIVPEEFGPNKALEAGKPLLGVYIIDEKRMRSIQEFWYPESIDDEEKLYGQIVDVGLVLEMSGSKREGLRNRYVIRLNSCQSESSGIFSLAHELGHMYGILNSVELHEADADKFADKYAWDRIKSRVSDESLRLKILLEALSNDSNRL